MNIKATKRHKWKRRILAGIVALFVLMQLIPYSRSHSNSPVTGEPPWDTPRTRELFFQACGDCHSNETAWPWYSHLAPASWLVQHDVDEGRAEFNVSIWDTRPKHGDRAAGPVREEQMPL